MITSTASVIAIRHIDSTFAELQRLQSVGDLAEDIDRRMNELRLAARDFVTDPGTQSIQVGEAADLAQRDPEEDPAGARARAAGHDRRRHRAAVDLSQRHRAHFGADQPPRRTDRGTAAAARDNSMPRSPTRPIPLIAATLSQTQSRIASALLAHNPSAAEQAAQSMRTHDDRRTRRCARPSTIMPKRSSRSRSANARSPISTRRCWAPRAA